MDLLAGPRRKFGKKAILDVIKTGIEYSVSLRNTWEVGFSVDYNVKFDTASS